MGPASSVTNRVAVFDGLTGKLLKDGGKTIAEIEAASVAKNNPITGATKTKITYDAKGLVTSGADATTADIADSANKRYVTDAEKTLLGNTSGVNTGDQTLPVKTTGAAINTGTNDTDFATPKAIADSYIGQRFYIPNYLINGNFDIVQRSSSLAFTNPATGSYTLDRYQIGISNSGTLPTSIIHARQPLTFGELPGSFYHYRINVNGAGSGFGANDLYNLSQKIEHGTRFLCGSGSKVTVSFFARSSISGKKIGLALRQSYGSGGSPSSEELINGTNWTLTSSWTKYKYTFTTNTLSGKTFGSDNNDFLQMEFGIMYGSTRAARFGDSATETFGGSGNIDIAKVKLEPGDVDTPFIPKSPDKELEACERYCQWIGDTTKLIQYGGSAATQDGGGNFRMYIPISLKTPMRIAPIATVFSDADTASKITVGDSGIYAGAPSNVDCNGTPVLNIGPDGGHVVVIHNAVFHVCKFYLRLEAEL